jgi:hypothetical protein
LKALDRDVNLRFQTAQDFADAIEEAIALPSARKMGEWVAYLGGQHLADASARLSAIESTSFEEDPLGPSVERQRPQSADMPVRPVLRRPGTYSEVTAVVEEVHGGKHEGVMRTSTSILLARGLSWGRRRWPMLAGATILMLITVVGVVGIVRASHLAEVKTTVDTRQAAQPALAARALPAPKDLGQPGLGTTAVLVESKPHPSTIPRPASPQTTAQSSATHRKAKRDCNPPFFFDGNGIRRVKPQCL